jgi:hypothetical protein
VIELLAMDNKAYINGVDETEGVYEVADCGNFLVPSTLSIPAYVKLEYNNYTANLESPQAVKIVVDGTISFNKEAVAYTQAEEQALDTTVKLYVNGSIVSKEQDILSFAQYVGAKVENADGDALYMPLEAAIDYAINHDGITSVDVGHVINGEDDCDYVTVTEDIVIPDGINVATVRMGATDNSTAKI